jgi:hypothetical protein
MSEIAAAPVDAAERGPLPAAPFVAAGALDALALAALLGHAGPRPLAVAAGLHLAALLPFLYTRWAVRPLTGSERALGAAFVLAFPVVGAPLAALSLGTVGESTLDPPPPVAPGLAELPRVEELRRLGEALPCCEALLAASAEERRAIIATLTRRADADAVALLRWALGSADAELAVDAAVAMEEMAASFEARLAEAREALAAPAGDDAPTGTAETALAAAEMVTQAIAAGVVDPALVSALAGEARGYFVVAADDAEPERALAAALGRAHLELEVLRPDTALACLDEALAKLPPEAEPALLALREEAVLASHALPWEGPSALATYQNRGVLPPPLTARRRFGTGRLGTGRFGTGRASVRAGTGGVTIGPVHVPPLSSTHKVPGPSSTHKVPAPSSTHKVPAPSSTHKVPAPSSTHEVPTPSSTHEVPTPSSTHKVPAPSSTHEVPTPSKPDKGPRDGD